MRPLLTLAAVFASALCALSVTIEPLGQKWVARYDSPLHLDDFSSVVATDAAGDLYVAGYTMDAQRRADACVIKYAGLTGERLWEWHANLPAFVADVTQGVMPMNSRLAIGPDGNPVLMANPGWNVLKLRASDGLVLWKASQPTLSGGSATYALALDANGNVFAGGVANGRGMTVKHSGTSGAIVWQRQFGQAVGYSAVAVRAVKADSNGDIVVTGQDYFGGSGAYYQAYTGKYAGSDGAVRWEQRLGNSAQSFQGRELVLDASGNAIVAMLNGPLCKYAGTDGTQLWQRQATATPFEMLVDATGDIYVASSFNTIYGTAAGATLAKFAGSDGSPRWTNSYGSEFYCSLLLRGTEVLVAGQRYSTSDDLLLTAFDPATGARRWDVLYGAPNLSDRMSSTYRSRGRIALQPDGGVVITGCSQGTGTGYDFATLRYAPGPGLKFAGISWVLPTSARLFTRAVDNAASATLAWQYGPTTAYGSTTAPVQIYPTLNYYPLNSVPAYPSPYYTTISGLPENTTFHARAVAISSAGTTYGEDLVFTTGWDANGDHLPDEWELARWGNTNARAATGDDDRDGLNNLLEYAFGRNPRAPDSAGAIPITRVGNYLTATITKQPFANYVVEASSDLRTWNTTDTTVLLNDATTLTVRDNFAITDAPMRFLRIRVTSQ